MRQRLWFLVGIVLALSGLTGAAAAAEYFTVVVLPDTQVYAKEYPHIFKAQTEWIVRNQDYYNIRLCCMRATSSIAARRGGVGGGQGCDRPLTKRHPTPIAIGNHDYDDWRNPVLERVQPVLRPERYEGKPWFGGAFEPGRRKTCTRCSMPAARRTWCLYWSSDPGTR